ncbi:MAG: D-alanine--D-alanine ligase [Bacteroidetes bacterium HGW-Bacteroidetes-19]|nr:MAG: D-alanine--D-alanine ligase [Bacteroidetes bacterium HGW-Bacteroidetes-20]PKP27684.1 MAG: D-alanine--D-alanine ligase [Bacteroidetes bacterium HGW-Bacteroidetes-19]
MITVAIFAGGNSGEHEISLKTGHNIQEMLDKTIFDTYFIVVKGVNWSFTNQNGEVFLINKDSFTLATEQKIVHFDVVFNAIHGDPGENGKLQSYFEMMNIPYTGCDSFCSALTFNKYFCNIAVEKFGVPIAPSVHFFKDEKIDFDQIIATCGLPCFVKPCNSGSSVGVNKAHNLEELKDFINIAFDIDDQIIIEQFIPGRELTCGVAKLKGDVKALAVSEILSSKEFYDFEAKYTPGFLEVVTPAKIDLDLENIIKQYSELIFKRFGCKGVVRVDFIVTSDNIPYFLEVNTIPGQTAVSLVPRQIKYNNIDLQEFYGALVFEAINKQ